MKKPIVHFVGEPVFHEFGGFDQAQVEAIDHPSLGKCIVTTSAILEKFDDGSFETRNSIYVSDKDNIMKNTNWVYFTFCEVELAAEYKTYENFEVEILKIELANSDINISDIVTEMVFVKAQEKAEQQERDFDEGRKLSALEGRCAE